MSQASGRQNPDFIQSYDWLWNENKKALHAEREAGPVRASKVPPTRVLVKPAAKKRKPVKMTLRGWTLVASAALASLATLVAWLACR